MMNILPKVQQPWLADIHFLWGISVSAITGYWHFGNKLDGPYLLPYHYL